MAEDTTDTCLICYEEFKGELIVECGVCHKRSHLRCVASWDKECPTAVTTCPNCRKEMKGLPREYSSESKDAIELAALRTTVNEFFTQMEVTIRSAREPVEEKVTINRCPFVSDDGVQCTKEIPTDDLFCHHHHCKGVFHRKDEKCWDQREIGKYCRRHAHQYGTELDPKLCQGELLSGFHRGHRCLARAVINGYCRIHFQGDVDVIECQGYYKNGKKCHASPKYDGYCGRHLGQKPKEEDDE